MGLDKCMKHFTLNRAWMPFSAACSSNRLFSSGLRFPVFSAACIWSKTALSSIAAWRVNTQQEWCQIHSGTLDKQEWRMFHCHWICDICPGHYGTNLQHQGMSGLLQDDVLLWMHKQILSFARVRNHTIHILVPWIHTRGQMRNWNAKHISLCF